VIRDVYDAPHKYAIRRTAIHHQPLSFMRRWKCQNIPRSRLFLKMKPPYVAVDSQRLYDTLSMVADGRGNTLLRFRAARCFHLELSMMSEHRSAGLSPKPSTL
jgi:hypothetical protein